MFRFLSRPTTRFALLAVFLLGLLVVHFLLDLSGLVEGHHSALSAAMLAVGGLVTAFGVWIGTREQRRGEEERQRMAERLRLSQRLEAVGRLTGGIAHEFNNWLTTILGYGDLLATRLGDGHPMAYEVSEIRRAGRRAASLVDQLLAFSRCQVIAPRVLDLNRVVEGTSEMLQRMIGEDVHLVCRLGSEPLRVEADPSQLEQLLVHLAVHSRDAMPQGGRLEISTSVGRLESARPGDLFEVDPGDYCRLLVTDTGGGLDADTLGHLFEPFYTGRDGGLGGGLGLASVYGIVKQNRGYIWVDTEPGAGTRFSVHLPRTHRALAAPEEQPPSIEGRSPERAERLVAANAVAGDARGTILLVEDEEMVRCLIREVLTQHGYRILEASGAQEALDRLDRHPGSIDLMLTDVVMPGMTGNTLAGLLAEERPDIRVLYISGYTESHLTQRGVLPPGERLLQKPFSTEELMAAVEEATGTRRSAESETLAATGT